MDTLGQLEQKISRAVEIIEKLKAENGSLKDENKNLRQEMEEIQGKLKHSESEDSQRAERIKGRLNSILDKLETLEEVSI